MSKSNDGKLICLDILDERWTAFIETQPQANIFHHPAWLNTITQAYGFKAFGLVLQGSFGEIRAALPIAYVKSPLTGKRWIAFPFSDHCCPLYRSEPDLALFLKFLLQFCREEKVDPLQIRWSLPQHPKVQARPEAVLHLLKLDPVISKVDADIHRNTRQAVQQAETRGVRVEMGRSMQDIHTFYLLQLETRRRQGVPVQPWRFFERMGKNLIEAGHGFILLAYQDDRCLAGAVFLNYQKKLTYKYSASSKDQLHLRPNNLILWRAIQWGCENGYIQLDLGKTDFENKGLRDFKNNWGAEEQVLTYSLISRKPIHARTTHLNSIIEKVIKRSPLWVCRLSGELLYKHSA